MEEEGILSTYGPYLPQFPEPSRVWDEVFDHDVLVLVPELGV